MDAFDRKINLKIIDQLRNLEEISLDSYIENVLMTYKKDNETFYFTLYKDIKYIINGLNKDEEADSANDYQDFVLDNGDLKLTGYQTRLHDISVWLYFELVKDLKIETIPVDQMATTLNDFKERLEAKSNYTFEYKEELDAIAKSLKKEKNLNYDREAYGIKKYLDVDYILDVVKIKPNIMGIELDISSIIDRFRN